MLIDPRKDRIKAMWALHQFCLKTYGIAPILRVHPGDKTTDPKSSNEGFIEHLIDGLVKRLPKLAEKTAKDAI